jgi:hypothetical protein
VNPTRLRRRDNACQPAPGDYSAPARKDALPRAALRRDGRVAEGARLESVYTGNRIVGSNPTPSATVSFNPVLYRFDLCSERSVAGTLD